MEKTATESTCKPHPQPRKKSFNFPGSWEEDKGQEDNEMPLDTCHISGGSQTQDRWLTEVPTTRQVPIMECWLLWAPPAHPSPAPLHHYPQLGFPPLLAPLSALFALSLFCLPLSSHSPLLAWTLSAAPGWVSLRSTVNLLTRTQETDPHR